MVRLAHVVKLSDDDLAALVPGLPEPDALARVRAWNPAAVLLYTRGCTRHSLARVRCRRRRPPSRCGVVDTVGAGDACLGGWIASWLDDARRAAGPASRLRGRDRRGGVRQAGRVRAEPCEVEEVLER